MMLPQAACGSSLAAVCYGIVSPTDDIITTATLRSHNCGRARLRSRPQAVALYFYHISERLDRKCEDIAEAALSLDDAWRTRIDLQFAPKSQNLDVDAPIEDILMDSRGLQ